MEHLLSAPSSKALVHFLRIFFANQQALDWLMNEVRATTEECDAEALCSLCQTAGECLMPTDRPPSTNRLAGEKQRMDGQKSGRAGKAIRKG
jgi:hypothetical protein